jgi:hypothetical protein
MSLGYVWEKFYAATLSLATGTDSIQRRLGGCYLQLSRLHAEDLPEDLRNEFNTLIQVLQHIYSFEYEDNTLENNGFKTDMEASQWAEQIFEMYNKITLRYGTSDEGQELARV